MKKLILLLGIVTALLTVLLIASTPSSAQNGVIKVVMSSLKSEKGECLIYLYKSEDGFPTKPELSFKEAASEIKAGKCTCEFVEVPYGNYAISVVHDENGNQKMDTNFVGIPKEGIGVSNNVKGSFGPPKFKDAKFNHDRLISTIDIAISY